MKTNCKIIFAVLALFELSACSDKKNNNLPPCLLTVDIHVINVDANTKYLVPVLGGGIGPYDYLWTHPIIGIVYQGEFDTLTVSRSDWWGKYMLRVEDVSTTCLAYDTAIVLFDTLKGTAGDPRFYLRFTNYADVDLDLHVRTPNNNVIFYNIPAADGGRLDLDCNCSVCTSEGIENIYWVAGTAPSGMYTFWAQFFQACDTAGHSSTYTLMRLKNNDIEEIHTGTLSSGSTPIDTFIIP